MITFESQEVFEEAVLEIIRNNLSITTSERTGGYFGDEKYTRVHLRVENEIISSDDINQ